MSVVWPVEVEDVTVEFVDAWTALYIEPDFHQVLAGLLTTPKDANT
jgi:hypothetical protein